MTTTINTHPQIAYSKDVIRAIAHLSDYGDEVYVRAVGDGCFYVMVRKDTEHGSDFMHWIVDREGTCYPR